jgi:hypothetical protein
MFGFDGVVIVVGDVIGASDLFEKMRAAAELGRGNVVGRLEKRLRRRGCDWLIRNGRDLSVLSTFQVFK